MTRRHEDRDCEFCFVKECDCDCVTCKMLQARNKVLSQTELDWMNVGQGLYKAMMGRLNAKTDEPHT